MIVIGIGANLPAPDGAPPLEAARRAAERLDTLPGLRLRALSRWFRTEPVPPSGQPSYINAIALLGTEPAAVEPWLLMRTLQGTHLGNALDAHKVTISGWTDMSFTASSAAHSLSLIHI